MKTNNYMPYFIKNAESIECLDGSVSGVCLLPCGFDEDDLNNELADGSEKGFFTPEEDLEWPLSKEISVKFCFKPRPSFGYATYSDYFLNSKWWETSCFENNRIIIEHSLNEKCTDDNLKILHKFVKIFIDSFHVNNSKLFIFNKTAVEFNLADGEIGHVFASISDNDIDTINQFIEWLQNSVETHKREKIVIISNEIQDFFGDESHSITFASLVKNFSHIHSKIIGKYDLYLENFNYDKFIKKLDENSEKFIDKISQTVSKLQNQILVLPIIIGSSFVIKAEMPKLPVVILTLLLIVIISYSLRMVWMDLNAIESRIISFQDSKKIPIALNKKWETEKTLLLEAIDRQRGLGYIYIAVIFLIFIISIIIILSLYSPECFQKMKDAIGFELL